MTRIGIEKCFLGIHMMIKYVQKVYDPKLQYILPQ